MKNNTQKQHAGVWIDNEKAIIFTENTEAESGYTVHQTIKAPASFNSGSEHTMHNAKQADSHKYLKAIAAELHAFDDLLLFGTGKSQEQLQNFLKEDAQFSKCKITVDNTEHLTNPQMIAKVRDFFKQS